MTNSTIELTEELEPRRKSQVGFLAVTRAVFNHRLSRVGLSIIILFCIIAILAPLLAPYNPIDQDLYNVLAAPSKTHLLGTDNVGRDLLSRIIYGTRISMSIGLFSTLFAVIVGVLVGLLAGYKGGVADIIIGRIIDVVMCLPGLVIILVLAAALGPGYFNIVIAISLTSWTWFARVMRGQVIQARSMPYVEASRAAGASGMRLMFKHLLPNSIAPIIVAVSMSMGGAILAEATVSFLGLGVQPPTPSWGRALRVGYSYLEMVPLYSIAPGFMIMLATLSFHFLGDGLRDALDPRLRGEGKKQ